MSPGYLRSLRAQHELVNDATTTRDDRPKDLNATFVTALAVVDATPQLCSVAGSFSSFRYGRPVKTTVTPRALMAAYIALGVTDRRVSVSAVHRLLTVVPDLTGPLTPETRAAAGLPNGPVSRAMVQYTADLVQRDTSQLSDDVRLWPTGNG